MAGDTGNQEGTPLSKNELRRQRQATAQAKLVEEQSTQTRRNFLKGVIATGVAAATGGIGWKIFGQSPTEGSSLSPGITAPSNHEQSLSKSYYIQKLKEIDNQIIKSPDQLKELAPQVGSLAVTFFCAELGYNPRDYDGKLRFLWDVEYRQAGQSEAGCINTNTPDDEYGRVTPTGNRLDINISKILYDDLSKKIIGKDPVVSLFGAVIHELHHLTTPILQNPSSQNPEEKIRGLVRLKPDHTRNNNDLICYLINRIQLEEAVVEHSTQSMLAKLGIVSPGVYARWVQAYQKGIVTKLFNGDHKSLLMLHQQTKPDEFFRLIGQKLGSDSEGAIKKGSEYTFGLLSNH